MADVSPEHFLALLSKGKPVPGILLLGGDSYLREMCRKKITEAYVPPAVRDWGITRFSAEDDEFSAILGQAETMPMLAQQQVNGDVVFAVSGEPIDFMHDNVIRPDRLDVFEHLLEAVTVGGAGRLSGVHVLMFRVNNSAKLRSLGVAGGTLRWLDRSDTDGEIGGLVTLRTAAGARIGQHVVVELGVGLYLLGGLYNSSQFSSMSSYDPRGSAPPPAPDRVVYLAYTTMNLPFGPESFLPSARQTDLIRRAAGVITSSWSPAFSSSAAQLENAPPSTFFTAMRNSPSSGPEQIE